MSADQAIPLIERQILRLDTVRGLHHNHPDVDAWLSTTTNILNAVYGLPNGQPHQNTQDLTHAYLGEPWYANMPDHEIQRRHVQTTDKRKALLEAYVEQLRDLAGPVRRSNDAPRTAHMSAIETVKTICKRFHIVARQITRRHANRSTLEINDEYDVQDLLHAILRIHFEDVRPEEWTPSYAGGSSRMDFLLKNEKIVIEAKMTREGLGDRQLGEQLIVDVARYSSHPDSETLVCFVHDADGHVHNPRGLEVDLARLSSPDLTVMVIIAP